MLPPGLDDEFNRPARRELTLFLEEAGHQGAGFGGEDAGFFGIGFGEGLLGAFDLGVAAVEGVGYRRRGVGELGERRRMVGHDEGRERLAALAERFEYRQDDLLIDLLDRPDLLFRFAVVSALVGGFHMDVHEIEAVLRECLYGGAAFGLS